MSRTLVLAGLLIDAWRDQSTQTEPTGMNPPGGAIPGSLLGGTSDDRTAASRLTSLIAVAALKRESR
jgi:hypothetical protein